MMGRTKNCLAPASPHAGEPTWAEGAAVELTAPRTTNASGFFVGFARIRLTPTSAPTQKDLHQHSPRRARHR